MNGSTYCIGRMFDAEKIVTLLLAIETNLSRYTYIRRTPSFPRDQGRMPRHDPTRWLDFLARLVDEPDAATGSVTGTLFG